MTTIVSWRPWLVCAVLLMATALSYLDRQALSVVAPLVREELRLDNAQLGLLLSAFFYSYAAMHLFVGAILDRFNIRYVYAAFVAAWSLAQACTGIARGFGALFASRMALGIFEAAAQPGAARIIARLVPAKDRTLANGIMMSGGSIGAMVAPLVMIWLASVVGWRAGFLLLGGAGLLWALFWLLWFRPPVEVLKGHAGGVGRSEADRWGVILRNPGFWACVAGAIFGIPIIHISSSWVPTFFVQEWKLPLTTGLGVYLFLVYLGLDLGFVSGGAAVSLLVRRGWPVGRARKAVLVGSTVCMLCACAVPWAPSVPAAVALVFLLNLGRASYGANFLAFNQDLAPGRVGTIAGLMGAIGAFSGALLVWAVGVLSKAGGFKLPFLIVGLLAVLGVIPLLVVDWDRQLPGRRGTPCAK